ncbi:MAG: NADH-quinone oxidoreductase subunit M [Lysobacterales bacterium CG02_land_8_20_14_3_00_62_12]|nr:MAG: NADH-quinone oxidoreductase subunit M [Xanthomonadales bacterium CG02_land_8_20_14_3_00_62_12]PJA37190.1 MAG: NADH-quinone oxidoreductase subunit M [Xanthomonadales bacterium CG_4_9_14_3_um_filter_62_6]
MSQHLLSWLIWLPILGAVATVVMGSTSPQRARWIALSTALLTFGLSVFLLLNYASDQPALQFDENAPWIVALNLRYHLAADGISLALIALTTFTTVLVLVGAWASVSDRVHQYLASFLLLESFMLGVFCARDALLFYMFFEAMLVPMFIIIGIWGGPRRVYATLKFFLYTFFGSIFMLVGLIYMAVETGNLDLTYLANYPFTEREQFWLFLAFLIAFAVKVPMFPVHTWLPDAHVEAPTGGSVILAAIMLKVGGYGFLRFSLPITPDAAHELAWLVIALSLIAVVYIGLVALVQDDMKKLIAYSSISHMGFVTLGMFVAVLLVRESMISATGSVDGARLALQGSMVQMISHGFVSAALFSCVGVMYERVHSRMIKDYGGLANTMPWFAALMVFLSMANSGLPGTSGFVGEFMVILASFQSHPLIAASAGLTLIIGAAYTLWLVKRVIFGAVVNPPIAKLQDVNARELLVLGGFALASLVVGLWPAPLVSLMDGSVNEVLQQLSRVKI